MIPKDPSVIARAAAPVPKRVGEETSNIFKKVVGEIFSIVLPVNYDLTR